MFLGGKGEGIKFILKGEKSIRYVKGVLNFEEIGKKVIKNISRNVIKVFFFSEGKCKNRI